VNQGEQKRPGLHAFIVGISNYRFLPAETEPLQVGDSTLGLQKLSTAASSAYAFYHWLNDYRDNLSLPLHSCRTLLVPSPSEAGLKPEIAELAKEADVEDFKKVAWEWRTDANSHPQNVALFYFAGHGVQRKRGDHVLLLGDFGKPRDIVLYGAIAIGTLMNGMAPAPKLASIARTQIYFFDACRTKLAELEGYEDPDVTPMWDVSRDNANDNRTVAVFETTEPGRAAYATKGGQSVFSEALIECLTGAAAVPPLGLQFDEAPRWDVTLNSLAGQIDNYVKKVCTREGISQRCIPSGTDSFVLLSLQKPPLVDITLRVYPSDARDCTKLKLFDALDTPVWESPLPIAPHPYRERVSAGNYNLRLSTDNQRFALKGPAARLVTINPPEYPLTVPLTLKGG
jgi:hypothetical protein